MKRFLNLIEEATPNQQPSTSTGAAATGQSVQADSDAAAKTTETKKGGFLQKAAAAGAKITAGIKQIEKIGTGKWDIAGTLQNILDRQLDSSTNKLGKFGKDGYQKIKLGSDIIEKITKYGSIEEPTVDDELVDDEVQSDDGSKAVPVEANESFNLNFIQKIHEAAAALDKNEKDKFKSMEQMAGDEDGKTKKQRVWDILKDALGLETDMILIDPDTGKKTVDRRIDWISKGVPRFLKAVKEIYPDIPFTYEGHDIKDGLSGAAVEQEEEFNFEETTRDEWVATLGEEKAEEIVRGLVDIYPGDRIVFEEPEDKPEDEPEPEDKPEDEPEPEDVVELTAEMAIFELANPNGFGQKGTQYTLKPLTEEVANILKQKDIKYLTYLNTTPQNEFKVPETNKGIIYAYDNNNEVINSITTDPAYFQWDGQEKLYTVSKDNNILMGVSYSEGQFPIKDTDASYIDPAGKYLIYKDKESGNLAKWPIVTQKSADGIYIVNKNKSIPVTEKDKNDMLKADGSTPAADIISKLKVGDVVAVTLAGDNDNSARVVTIVKTDDKTLTVNDHNKPNSSNYPMAKDNIKDISYFKK